MMVGWPQRCANWLRRTTTVGDGLTTYHTIPDPVDLIGTILQTAFNDFLAGQG